MNPKIAWQKFLYQYRFDAADAGGAGFFFENFEVLAAFANSTGMGDVRATANFAAEMLAFGIADGVDLHGFAVLVAKGAGYTVCQSLLGIFLAPADRPVFLDLFVDDFLYLGNLLRRHFFGVGEVEPHALSRDIAAALHYVVAQHILKRPVH